MKISDEDLAVYLFDAKAKELWEKRQHPVKHILRIIGNILSYVLPLLFVILLPIVCSAITDWFMN